MKPAEALQGSYLPALSSDTSYLTSVHTGKLYPNAIFSTLPPVQLLKGFSNTPVCAVTNRVQSVWVESTLYKEMGAHVGETVSMPRLLYVGHLCVLLLVTLMLKVGHCAQPQEHILTSHQSCFRGSLPLCVLTCWLVLIVLPSETSSLCLIAKVNCCIQEMN